MYAYANLLVYAQIGHRHFHKLIHTGLISAHVLYLLDWFSTEFSTDTNFDHQLQSAVKQNLNRREMIFDT